MLGAVRELGQHIIDMKEKEELDVFIEDPNTTGNYTNVIAINFEQTGKLTFTDAELDDYDEGKKRRYLYRRGAAMGSDYSPTAKLSGKPKGTFDRKILGWFRILDDKNIRITDDDREFLSDIRKGLEENSDYIKEKIVDFRDSIPKKYGILVTLKIKQNEKTKYVGDIPVFKELLIARVKKADERISAANKVCSICGERKDTILGNINTYAFYTVDKPGFIAGDFDLRKSWRNYPVCRSCKTALEEGKKFIEENLTFRFCGIPYNLIPKFVIGKESIDEYLLDIFTDTSKLISLKEERVVSITGDEEEILNIIQDAKDTLTLNFLFIHKRQAAERILLVIEDVFPSRLGQIFDEKYKVDEIYKENFTFRSLRNFFAKSDKNNRNYDLDKYFLDIIDRIFKGRPVSYSFILQFMMKKIRDEFINDGYFNFAVKDSLITIAFLEKLKLIKMEENEMEERVFDDMFQKYGPTFETPLKRGLFLLGSLAELLLRKQYSDRKAKPFLNNLKSLKMNERDFKGLLPKVQNKLEEYDSFDKGKRVVAKEASNYLLLSGEDWKMPVDELNFYFASGMNLIDEVTRIIYKDKELDKKENEQE